MAGPGVLGEGDTHDPDRPGPGDENVLPGEFHLLAGVHRIAEWVKECSQFRVNRVGLNPDVRGWNHHVISKCAVPVNTDPSRIQAHVTTPGPTVAAPPAHDVPFDADQLPNFECVGSFLVRYALTQFNNGSGELVTQRLRWLQ